MTKTKTLNIVSNYEMACLKHPFFTFLKYIVTYCRVTFFCDCWLVTSHILWLYIVSQYTEFSVIQLEIHVCLTHNVCMNTSTTLIYSQTLSVDSWGDSYYNTYLLYLQSVFDSQQRIMDVITSFIRDKSECRVAVGCDVIGAIISAVDCYFRRLTFNSHRRCMRVTWTVITVVIYRHFKYCKSSVILFFGCENCIAS